MKREASSEQRAARNNSAPRPSPFVLRQEGATLLELLVTLSILTSALVIFISALSTGAFAVRASDQLTTATNLATSQLESIKGAGYLTGTASYPVISGGGYAINQQIDYWDGATFSSNPLDDSGMQWITITVSYQNDTLITVANYKVNR